MRLALVQQCVSQRFRRHGTPGSHLFHRHLDESGVSLRKWPAERVKVRHIRNQIEQATPAHASPLQHLTKHLASRDSRPWANDVKEFPRNTTNEVCKWISVRTDRPVVGR